MEDQKHIMTLEKGHQVSQISLDGFIKLGVTLAETSLSTVDFKKIKRTTNQTHDAVIKEYLLLKTGMYETWEVLYYNE
ncbi:hypothetical protein LCGC14_1062260 [marine sediment metagenome]|uniref:Uncharacterized protein n=1 Tax=marine sediment metagenome TaxID=412755 RepID=A0A0F9Q3R6_9ZZZZ